MKKLTCVQILVVVSHIFASLTGSNLQKYEESLQCVAFEQHEKDAAVAKCAASKRSWVAMNRSLSITPIGKALFHVWQEDFR